MTQAGGARRAHPRGSAPRVAFVTHSFASLRSGLQRRGEATCSRQAGRCVPKMGVRDSAGAAIAAAVALTFNTVTGGGARAEGVKRFTEHRTELVADVSLTLLDDKEAGRLLNDRQLRSRRITKVSPAQEEMLDVDMEWEQLWYIRFLQYALVWCVVPVVALSAAGMGMLFERWTKAQEEAEREEEIKLTGSYSNPATVRKEEKEEKKAKKKKKSKKGDTGSGGAEGKNPPSGPTGSGGGPSRRPPTQGPDSGSDTGPSSGSETSPPTSDQGASPPAPDSNISDEDRRNLERLFGSS